MKSLAEASAVLEIRDRIGRLHPQCQRQWGRMTAHEMVCHMGDSFEIVLDRRCVEPIKTPLPPAVMKWFALQLPMRWPKGVPTAPEVEQGVGGTHPSDWERDHRRLREVFDAFCAKREAWPQHPFFREMSVADWMRWGYLHSDHHLRQFGL